MVSLTIVDNILSCIDADIFIDDGTNYIVIHRGLIILPDFGENYIGRNLIVVTPCDILVSGLIRTWNSTEPTSVAGNITLIAGGSINDNNNSGMIDVSPNNNGFTSDSSLGGVGGICTLIAQNIQLEMSKILICNRTTGGSGRALIASATDAIFQMVGRDNGSWAEGAHDVITISAGRSLASNSIDGFNFYTLIPATINIIAGADVTIFDNGNANGLAAPAYDGTGGNVLLACGGSLIEPEGSVAVESFQENNFGGNIFITTGGNLNINSIFLSGVVDGQAIFIVGGDAAPTINNIDYNHFINVIVYTLCPLDDMTYFFENLNVGTLTVLHDANIWSSMLTNRLVLTASPASPCAGILTVVSASGVGSDPVWTLIDYPDGYVGPTNLFSGSTSTSFMPTVVGDYIVQISVMTEGMGCGYDMTQNCRIVKTITLSVSNPPVITLQPISTTVLFGKTLTLKVVAIGNGPFSYQWYKNDAPITNATGATYTKSNVDLLDSGSYTVIVTDPGSCAVTSNQALIFVNSNVPFVPYKKKGQ